MTSASTNPQSMGSKTQVVHDFMGIHPPHSSPSHPRLNRRQSFRGITKMNPEIVKSVIDSASRKEKAGERAAMTIFYKGTVSVFDLPMEQADSIFQFVAENSSVVTADHHPLTPTHILDNDGDLSIKPNKSLQRFFQKRKDRLISDTPYESRPV